MRPSLRGFFGKAILAFMLVFAIAAIVQATTDGYQPMRQAGDPAIGLYKSSPSTLSDGDYDVVRLTSAGLLRTSVDGSAATGSSSLTVQGAGASAAALVGKPVLAAGGNGTNAYTMLTDQNGMLSVSGPLNGWYVAANTALTAAQTTSAAKLAGASGVKHVATGVHALIYGDSTGNADQVTLVLRDGATGAGTIVASWQLKLATGANTIGTLVDVAGLAIVGTSATGMTLEITGASATHSIVTCSLYGYDVKP